MLLALSFAGTISADERFNFEHFSFAIPENDAWMMLTTNPNQVAFIASVNKTHYRMTLLENIYEGRSIVSRTAQSVADDFREHEKQGMIELGVNQGLYELHDLTMGETMVGDKLFYTMTYTTEARSGFKSAYESAMLYLYFPNENYVEEFFLAHYTESASKRKRLNLAMESDFLRLLKSVSIIDPMVEKSGKK